MNEKPTETPSLSSLNEKLDALQKSQAKSAPSSMGASGDAARAAIDFASASAVGCGLGFGVDEMLHTSPWGLVGGLILGVVAGFFIMMKVTLSDIKKDKDAK